MAHAAEIDPQTGEVLRVVVINNAMEPNVEQFCVGLYGGVWKQTSYNANFRKNYAGVGYTYRADIDAFVPPQPYQSWTLNTATAQWQPPVPMPQDGTIYEWDEDGQAWVPQPGMP